MDEEKQNDAPETQNEETSAQSDALESDMETEAAGEKSMAPVLGAVIVVIILVIAAFYVWGNQSGTSPDPAVNEPGAEMVEEQESPADTGADEAATSEMEAEDILDAAAKEAAMMEEQSTSDEIADIEADLNASDFDSLGTELDDIGKELQ